MRMRVASLPMVAATSWTFRESPRSSVWSWVGVPVMAKARKRPEGERAGTRQSVAASVRGVRASGVSARQR